MTCVNASDLSDEQKAVVDQVRTIIREKQVPVAGHGNLRPAQVVTKVALGLARPFTLHMHTQSWRYFKARPLSDAADQAATRADFCRWNPAFEQYVYTEAWGIDRSASAEGAMMPAMSTWDPNRITTAGRASDRRRARRAPPPRSAAGTRCRHLGTSPRPGPRRGTGPGPSRPLGRRVATTAAGTSPW